MAALELAHSRVFPVPVERAFDTLLPAPLEDVFGQRFALIAPIVATEQDGVWGTVGQTRLIRQSDGSRMREELTSLTRPASFGYTITVVRGPLKLLAGPVRGTWSFDAVDGGTEITWRWSVPPASAVAGLVLPALRPLWQGFARRGFDRIATLLAS